MADAEHKRPKALPSAAAKSGEIRSMPTPGVPTTTTESTTRRHPTMAPLPTPEGFMTKAAKLSLADIALQLRDEQLEAKVVHYRADLQTNAELDAITAQVITELQNLQAAAKAAGPSSRPLLDHDDRADVELE